MKILGVKTAYRLTKDKIKTAFSVVTVMGLCCASAIAVDALLNFSDVQALRVEPGDVVDYFDVIPDEFAPDRENNGIKNPNPASDTKAAQKMNSTEPTTTETEEPTTTTTESETEEETEPTSETAETTTETTEPTEETTEPTEATTKAPTKVPTKGSSKITEKAFKRTVYARAVVNIRTGPGTSYKVIRKVNMWKPISVVAKTSNGWYKTADGGYVKQSLTTLSAPKPTATPKPTKAPTKKPTPKATTKNSTIKKTNGVKCKITFYGPVLYKRKDGSTFYSTTTATGTKCKQGQTCAADWSVFPKKSWIYIEKDPLGGDGLYKVEDTGRFKGNWIDIYVDSAKGHNTCYRMVYQQ